jgi:hypothetical protein
MVELSESERKEERKEGRKEERKGETKMPKLLGSSD